MNDKKRVLKEFEWFEVQTKVRQIIAEVLEPLQKRLMSNTHSLSKLQTHSQAEQKKVQYLTLMLNNDPNIFEHGIFASIDNKIKETSIHTKQLEAKVTHLQHFIDQKTQLLQGRLRESNSVLQGLREFKTYVDLEITNNNNKLVQSQVNLFSSFQQINKDIKATMLGVEQVGERQEAGLLRVGQQQESLHERQLKLHQSISVCSAGLKEIRLGQELQAAALAQLQQDATRAARFEKYTRQLGQQIQHLAIALDNVEYKTQVLQPIVALTQINEYAHHVLPAEYHSNISIYYHNRYRQMVEQIIAGELTRDQKHLKVASSRKLNLQLVKQVHKRAIKCVFKVKKRKLAEQGIDIDSLTHDRKEQLLNGMHLHEEFKDEVEAKTAPEKEDSRVKLQEEDYKQLRERLEGDLKLRMEQEIKDSKNYILEMDELLRKQLEGTQQQLAKLERQAQDTQLSLQLEGRALQRLQQQLAGAVTSLEKGEAGIVECLRNINAVVSVHQLIEKQDEKDRLSIALVGVREQHRDEVKELQQGRRSPLQLSPNCLSCSGNPNYYNQFFKMACLNYSSSPIKFNSELYHRAELLEKTQAQLQKVAQYLDPHSRPPKSLSKQQPQAAQQEKMHRYESQMMGVAPRDLRSASEIYMARNVSSSQEIRPSRMEKGESPRLIDSNELVQNLMGKNANRLFSRKRDGLRDYRRKKESSSKQSQKRSDYMINVSSYFKELRKQNQSFIK